MKKFFSNTMFFALIALVISSCGGKKAAEPEVKEFDKYADPSTKMELQFPKGWAKGSEVGRSFVAYSSAEAKREFLNIANMEGEDVPGARIYVTTIKVEEGKTIQETIDATRQFDASIYSSPANITIDGTPASKQTYSFDFKTSKFNGEMYYATKDSQMINIITFDVIGDSYEALKPKFAEVLKSFKLGTMPQVAGPNVITKTDTLPGPSDKFVAANGQGFSIQIPDNFKSKGGDKSFTYSGDRRGDSYVQIDILDAKGNKLDKILEDNAKKFGAATKSSIGGTEAGMFNYKAKADLDSKIYFVIHSGKLYRIFVNYYKPDAKLYKPAFDKMIKSIKWN